MSTTSTPSTRLPRTETNDPNINQQDFQQGADPQSQAQSQPQSDPNVVAGIETLLKIPAKVIGKAKSQHPGQPCHVTLELALANGPQQISVTMGSNDDAGMFKDTVAYRARKPGQQGLVAPGTLDNYGRDMSPSPDMAQMERVHNEPQRVYVLVVDADYLDDYDKEFQGHMSRMRQSQSKPVGLLDEFHESRYGTYDQGSHQVPGATEYARDDSKVATPSTPSTPTTTAPNASQPGGTAPGVQSAGTSPGATSPAPNTPADIRNPRYAPTAPSPEPGALTPEEKNYKDQADLRKKQEEDNQRQNR